MSGLLETFYFLFTSDAKKLDQGLKDSDKTNKKLTENLLATDKVAEKLGQNLVEIGKQAAGTIASILAFAAVKTMIIDQANLSDQMAKTALNVRANVENMTAYSRAAVDAGGDANSFAATLERLGQHGRDPIAMLEQLRSRFQGLSEAQALRLGKLMGFDVGTVELLTKTKAELAAIIAHQKELGVVTREQAIIARLFNNQLRDTGAVYDDIKRKISTAIIPTITEFFHILERMLIWLRDNKTFTLSFFSAVAAVISTTYLPAIVSAAAATFALIAPYIAIAAAVAAVAAVFALAYDDVMAFLAGNDSVIGELSKKWPIVGELVHDLADTLLWLKDIVGNVFNFIVDTLTVGPVQAFDNLVANIVRGSEKIKDKFPELYAIIQMLPDVLGAAGSIVEAIWNGIVSVVTGGIDSITTGIDKLKSMYTAVKDFLSATDKANPLHLPWLSANAATQGSSQLAAVAAHPMAAITSNAISNSMQNNNSRSITISAPVTIDASGQDPDKVQDAIRTHLENAIKSAINHHDDGLAV